MLACTKEPPLSIFLHTDSSLSSNFHFSPFHPGKCYIMSLNCNKTWTLSPADQEAHYYNPSNKYITALRPFTAKTESLRFSRIIYVLGRKVSEGVDRGVGHGLGVMICDLCAADTKGTHVLVMLVISHHLTWLNRKLEQACIVVATS